MTENTADVRAVSEQAPSRVQAQSPERVPAEQAQEPNPGGELRVPLAEELAWANVLRPGIPLVYLDLNHYIYLAQAFKKSASAPSTYSVLPGYSELAAAARAAKASGRAMFPLSGVHLMELSKVQDPAQRADVATAMEELSGFNYLLDRSTLTRLEMEAGLNRIYGQVHGLEETVPLIGQSFAHGFGRVVSLVPRDAEGQNVSDEVRRRIGDDAYRNMLADMNLEMERAMLRGPSDEEIPYLRSLGWDPDVFRRGHERRLGFELQTRQTLVDNPGWRSGRLRDLISGRDVVHEWLEILLQRLRERKEDDLPHEMPSETEMPRFWAAMPQVQVAISIKTRNHRNLQRQWKVNDIADIDAMSVAYPYCHAVFTDKDVRAALVDDRDLRRIKTFMPKRPDELTAWLDDLPPVPNPMVRVAHMH